MKSWFIGKDSDAGRDWGQEEKGTTEDEMTRWHHWLDGRESEWTSGVGDGQGGLACCDSWGRKESDTTERLNWTVLGKSTLKVQSKLKKPFEQKTVLPSREILQLETILFKMLWFGNLKLVSSFPSLCLVICYLNLSMLLSISSLPGIITILWVALGSIF